MVSMQYVVVYATEYGGVKWDVFDDYREAEDYVDNMDAAALIIHVTELVHIEDFT